MNEIENQPEALRLADWLKANSAGIYRPAAEAAAELQRLHVENQYLKEQMAAIGAGGVEPLRKSAVQAAVPEVIEQMVADRYKVVPSHESMFHRWAVVADNGAQQLYIGREGECQNMARKFMGAFLDGAFVAMQNAAAPQGLDAQVQDRLDRLYLALEVCSAELFAQCADQGRAMKYVDQARSALAAEQCARAAQAKQQGKA